LLVPELEKEKVFVVFLGIKSETVIVPDVEKFNGHITCSSLSKSEIVIPILKNKEVIAVLDVDSSELNTFDEVDNKYLSSLLNEIIF